MTTGVLTMHRSAKTDQRYSAPAIQKGNPANRRIHRVTTAEEVWRDFRLPESASSSRESAPVAPSRRRARSSERKPSVIRGRRASACRTTARVGQKGCAPDQGIGAGFASHFGTRPGPSRRDRTVGSEARSTLARRLARRACPVISSGAQWPRSSGEHRPIVSSARLPANSI